jgi:hypothetical protein
VFPTSGPHSNSSGAPSTAWNGIEVFSGHGGGNRFGVSGWEQTLGQQFRSATLGVRGITYPEAWEAHLVTYWAGEALVDAAELLHETVSNAVVEGAPNGT